MRLGQRMLVTLLALLSTICCLPSAFATIGPQDVVTVGSVTAVGALVDVPVYVRDVSGTPVGLDQPPGSKIQSFSLKVDYAPAAAITSISFVRTGVTSGLTPTAEFTPSSPGSVSLIDTFQESTNPIPFTLDAAAPGNPVGHLLVQLSPSAVAGSTITVTLDPALTTLANQDGTTVETSVTSSLLLVNGSITIPPGYVYNVPALSTWALALLALMLAVAATRLR